MMWFLVLLLGLSAGCSIGPRVYMQGPDEPPTCQCSCEEKEMRWGGSWENRAGSK